MSFIVRCFRTANFKLLKVWWSQAVAKGHLLIFREFEIVPLIIVNPKRVRILGFYLVSISSFLVKQKIDDPIWSNNFVVIKYNTTETKGESIILHDSQVQLEIFRLNVISIGVRFCNIHVVDG